MYHMYIYTYEYVVHALGGAVSHEISSFIFQALIQAKITANRSTV